MKDEADVMIGGVGMITVEIAFAMLLRSVAMLSSREGTIEGMVEGLDLVNIGRKMGRERSSIN